MRRILVESIRQTRSLKQGGDLRRIGLDRVELPAELWNERLLALDSALDRLEEVDAVKADLIKLRIFSGLSKVKATKALGIFARTVDRYWSFARAWLINEMREDWASVTALKGWTCHSRQRSSPPQRSSGL
jgi:hypothetical protein